MGEPKDNLLGIMTDAEFDVAMEKIKNAPKCKRVFYCSQQWYDYWEARGADMSMYRVNVPIGYEDN